MTARLHIPGKRIECPYRSKAEIGYRRRSPLWVEVEG